MVKFSSRGQSEREERNHDWLLQSTQKSTPYPDTRKNIRVHSENWSAGGGVSVAAGGAEEWETGDPEKGPGWSSL